MTAAPDSSLPVLAMPPTLRRWDVFCRVIDNHGDLGVCWRLACDLAERGAQVRLWIDDAAALAWMAPEGSLGVQVLPWRNPLDDEAPADLPQFPEELRVATAEEPLAFLRAVGFID